MGQGGERRIEASRKFGRRRTEKRERKGIEPIGGEENGPLTCEAGISRVKYFRKGTQKSGEERMKVLRGV